LGVYARQRVPLNKRKPLALFFTCKQMPFETAPVFYRNPIFELRNLGYITLSTLRKKYRHLISFFVLDYTMVHSLKEGNARHTVYVKKRMEPAKHINVYIPSDTPDTSDLGTQAKRLSYTGWKYVDIKIKIDEQ
jgi:hypothetical protein